MKPLLQKNLISVAFVIVLLVIGLSIASLFIFELTNKERLAFILIAVSCFFTALSLFFEIIKRANDKEN